MIDDRDKHCPECHDWLATIGVPPIPIDAEAIAKILETVAVEAVKEFGGTVVAVE